MKIKESDLEMFVDWNSVHTASIPSILIANCHTVLGLHLLLISENSIHSCPDESTVQLAFFYSVTRLCPEQKF